MTIYLRYIIICTLYVFSTMDIGAEISWLTPDVGNVTPGSKVLLYFHDDRAKYCHYMMEDVWSDPRINNSVNANYLPYIINIRHGSNALIAEQYRVYRVPTTVVWHNGTEINRIDRRVGREDMLRFLGGERISSIIATPPINRSNSISVLFQDDPPGDAIAPHLDITHLEVGSKPGVDVVVMTLAGTPPDEPNGLMAYKVFIDADCDPGTGYSDGSSMGGDILLESERVHRFSGSARGEWNWSELAMANVTISGSEITWEIPKSVLGSGTEAISIWATTTAKDWSTADRAPDSSSITRTEPDAGNIAAPTSNVAFTHDTTGDVIDGKWDIETIQTRINEQELVIAFENRSQAPEGGLHVFINSDNNESSGYKCNSYQAGADIMIEGATIHRFSGSSDNEWTWSAIGQVDYAANGPVGTYTIDLGLLGSRSPISLWLSTYDQTWITQDWAPDNAAVEISYKR